MKTLLLFLVLCVSTFGADLVTQKGVRYTDYQIKSVDKESIRISHRDGMATLDFDELPSDLQTRFGWTPEKSAVRAKIRADAIVAEKAQAAKAMADAEKAEADKAQRELAQKQTTERLDRMREENAKAAKEAKEKAAQRLAQEQEEYQQRRADSEQLQSRIIFWSVLAGFLFVNFIPTFVAKGKSNFGAVVFVNMLSLMIGILQLMFASEQWHVIAAYASAALCWFIALIMAFRKAMFGEHQPPQIIYIQQAPPQGQPPRKPIAQIPRVLPPQRPVAQIPKVPKVPPQNP